MERVGPREVILTPEESEIQDRWNELLDKGWGNQAAAEAVTAGRGMDPAFVEYLGR